MHTNTRLRKRATLCTHTPPPMAAKLLRAPPIPQGPASSSALAPPIRNNGTNPTHLKRRASVQGGGLCDPLRVGLGSRVAGNCCMAGGRGLWWCGGGGGVTPRWQMEGQCVQLSGAPPPRRHPMPQHCPMPHAVSVWAHRAQRHNGQRPDTGADSRECSLRTLPSSSLLLVPPRLLAPVLRSLNTGLVNAAGAM